MFDSVKKEGQSSFNNVNTYGISDTKFSKSFGFSNDEVDTLINKLQLSNKSAIIKQNIKDWYNGYTAPVSDNAAVQVYTPWSVMSYLKEVSLDNLQPQRLLV
ncbi:P-loop NTPase family protein [Candidatus Midichloria mitochondrii]|uniref:Uncharacterized protein n=1 Tax=Midichloria mitochondrii (strain IricVA) TaxID=696127 RepID=F7XUR4_MIDMI|nr:AAA family ATPase [Candidatus Midichloria mitochondrii]AEI88413.1 hypothetical protein midi_00089 [Candidatus Midichloria mitochondrii IricVA]